MSSSLGALAIFLLLALFFRGGARIQAKPQLATAAAD